MHKRALNILFLGGKQFLRDLSYLDVVRQTLIQALPKVYGPSTSVHNQQIKTSILHPQPSSDAFQKAPVLKSKR